MKIFYRPIWFISFALFWADLIQMIKKAFSIGYMYWRGWKEID